MKKASLILFSALLLIGNTAMAQGRFRKPLQSQNTIGANEARYNIGITGGLTTTHWLHFGGTGTKYHQPFNFGPIAGITVERMFNSNSSIAVEGLFAMRNTHLDYNVLNFPVAINVNKDYYRQYDVNYMEVAIQVPLTYYFSQGDFRPYVFIAPRFTLPLSGKMEWQKMEIIDYGTENQHYSEEGAVHETVDMTGQNMRRWNIGLVAGVGVRYRLRISNYYLLFKLDLSGHAALINSFSKEEINGESENVIGASYIDPYLMQKRFNTDASVKLSILFPLKKPLKGACMRWGEYD
jgi:hypothetical protein